MKKSSNKAALRQAAFAQLWGEYEDEHGVRFVWAWSGVTCCWGELRTQFMEELARRAEGISLQTIGEAIAGAPPPGWHERERSAWVLGLGLLGIEYVNETSRPKLVATAELLGLRDQLHKYGVTW